jgi:hypothetical protein
MPHATSAGDGLRVVMHPRICPDCGSADVTQSDVETGDGITETALTCRDCGTAWPVACVTDWPYPSRPDVTGYGRDPQSINSGWL